MRWPFDSVLAAARRVGREKTIEGAHPPIRPDWEMRVRLCGLIMYGILVYAWGAGAVMQGAMD